MKIISKLLINLLPLKKWRHKAKEILYKYQDHKQNDVARQLKLELKKTQNVMSKSFTKGSYYNKAYGLAEYKYWAKLLEWMYLSDNYKKKKITVLDIGCAYGTLAVFAKMNFNADVYCIDIAKLFPKKLSEKLGIVFKCCNIEKETIPFDTKFDIVIFTEVFEHLNFNPIATLIKIKKSLKKDGAIYFSTPNAEYWGRTEKYYKKFSDIPTYTEEYFSNKIVDDHVWQYNWPELLYCFEKSGLVPVKIDYSDGGRHFNILLKNKQEIQI